MTDTNDNVAERVRRVIAKHMRISEENVTNESTFADLNIDSLDGVNLLFELENEFDINIEDDQARSITSVPEMIEGIKKLLAEKQANAAPSSQPS
jgi:acyl carrier protein